jgi:hypothetical protein
VRFEKKRARLEFRGESYGRFKFGLLIRVSSEVLEGWGFGFVDRVDFRDMIYFVDRVGCRDRIYFVDSVGFRDKICFVDMVSLDTGSILWIGSVLEIGSVLWIGSVGGLLRRRRSFKKKHLWKISIKANIARRYMPKVPSRELQHSDMP